ncbi:hypothetical protein J3E68DRAFT_395039 [Trichoderma sp. SZMC 28012]|uniref:Uncharacterized protein n=1 Tax=Trichoderma harzianum CBS 226.95 TaxID=983964 RepID=A0A2T4AHU7_TRIHA|nr:hypothetical protein M431DRAFT_493143 [Trichoderma harzianum CBS 226.95]PTB56665.1 hypothetical protein M431DRAFT_493143 [Trichoderma harzianum CBS 226.95]
MCAAGGLGWSCGFARPLGRAANATACQGYGTRWEARDAAVYIPARWRALYPKVSRRHREGGGQAKAEIRACKPARVTRQRAANQQARPGLTTLK